MTRRASAEEFADIASGRAAFYDLLIAVFEIPPEQGLLAKIRSGEFERLLTRYRGLGKKGFAAGLDRISSYRSAIRERPDEVVLTELSVDRTKILRGTGHGDMKPPYEGLYKRGAGFGDSVLMVKRFYRKAGMVTDETVTDAADYLCVELDFMKQLCLREETLRLRAKEIEEPIAKTIAGTIELEEEFLRVHLGSWVGAFCSVVGKHASTDFYRGFALIMDAFIRTDREWLESLVKQ